VAWRLEAVQTELYCSAADRARFAFEVILSIAVFAQMLWELWQIGATQIHEGNMLKVSLKVYK
jgi:hypothetical protein